MRIPLRVCRTCGLKALTWGDLGLFVKYSAGKLGRAQLCSVCHKQKAKEYREANGDKVRAAQRKSYRKNKAHYLLKSKKWAEDNQEKTKEYKYKYYIKNSVKVSEAATVWKSSNPEKVKVQRDRDNRKRRARKAEVKENYTKEDSEFTRKLFNGRCFNCGCSENLCVDHHYPLSKGYALTRTNAVILCGSCNASKGNKLPEDFYNVWQLAELERLL